jgi:RNA ligase (TIGR02306 family)
MRKLVSIQRIESLTPIEGADSIESAKVLGWNVVVQKNKFHPNDKVAYFEIDSFLPENLYEEFQKHGQRTLLVNNEEIRGHVLKTIKLRGTLSQGLILALEDVLGSNYANYNLEIGDDLTELAGVHKWEPPLPQGNGEIIGAFDTRFAPKSDAVRLQNLFPSWGLIKALQWEPTVKVDGSSHTLVNDNGAIRIFGRNWELSQDSLGFKVAHKYGLIDVIQGLSATTAIQFELAGPGIQGNPLRLSIQTPFIFSLWENGQKVPREDWSDEILSLSTPLLDNSYQPSNFSTPEALVSKVDGISGNITPGILDEGVVFHPKSEVALPLAKYLDRNGNWKIISNKWLLKNKD